MSSTIDYSNEIKSQVGAGLSLPVMEHFYTLQGEGYYTGQAAYFIRLAGCDVGCVWCDVKDRWEQAQESHQAGLPSEGDQGW